MKPIIHVLVLFLLGTSICLAQETQTTTSKKEPLAGFAWLEQFAGTWTTAYNGTMKSQVVGKIWVVNELSFQGGLSAVQSIGYDSAKKQFIGSWIDSTSSYLWHYTGSLDATGHKLTLAAEGPDFTDPTKTRSYRDIYEFKSENEIAAISQMLNDKGEWQTFNTSAMTRKTK